MAGSASILVHNASNCPKAIALGLTRAGGNDYALQDFADTFGAQHYDHWDDFESVVRNALKEDSTTKIYFNLEDVRTPAEWAKTANLKNPYASDLTAWELAMIKAAPPSAQARVVWVNGDNPFPSTGK